ncbi:MAG TPA: hypothetical protein VFS10_04055 [Pyrinomonadaceae bacterium]|nr:hypothetical protein [Pyrinomonadaceae bacterium]
MFGALAGLAAAGAAGAALWTKRRSSMREKRSIYPEYNRGSEDRWARPGMRVTFRAELMPGREREARTFSVKDVMPSGRVTLEGFAGEHAETEFEAAR